MNDGHNTCNEKYNDKDIVAVLIIPTNDGN